MEHNWRHFYMTRLVHHSHLREGTFNLYALHSGNWLSDFPKMSALFFALLVAYLFIRLLSSVPVSLDFSIWTQAIGFE